jgi:hypothetical protein
MHPQPHEMKEQFYAIVMPKNTPPIDSAGCFRILVNEVVDAKASQDYLNPTRS